MDKSKTVRARIEPTIKKKAEKVLSKIGLEPSEAVRLYYHAIVNSNGIPFPIRLPNAATRKAIKDSRQGKGRKHQSTEQMDEALGI